MMMTKLKRVFLAGFVNFWRNGVVSLASVLMLTVTLFVIGSLIFAQALLNSAIAQVKDKVDVNVYFKTDAPESAVLAVKTALERLPEVKQVEYVSRDQALAAFRARHQANSLILSALDEIGTNPLGAVLNVRAQEPSQYATIAKFLQPDTSLGNAPQDGVDRSVIESVNYFDHQTVIARLNAMIAATERLGFAVAVVFILLAVLVSFNTIRLAIYTAREEIAVMKLVGASNNYVRGPFLVEGMMEGAIAALCVLLLFAGVTNWIGSLTEQFFGGINLASYYGEHFVNIAGALFGAGVLIGMTSALFAVRRYLNV